VGPGSHTLETGAGLSTAVFASTGADHICITPEAEEADLIREFCRSLGVDSAGVRFEVMASEAALPAMRLPALDLALIDGRHGFPAPFIDWHYIAPALAVKGLLLVDDIQLWTCRTLVDFLDSEPEWEREETFEGRTALFRKTRDGDFTKEWVNQPYVVRRTEALNDPPGLGRRIGLALRAKSGPK
jgi:hypothetical protein